MFCTLFKKKSISCTSTTISNIYIYSSRTVPFLMSPVSFSHYQCVTSVKTGPHLSHLPSLLWLLVSEKTFFARKPTDKHATVCLKPTWLELEICLYVTQWKNNTIYNTCACREGSSWFIYASGRGQVILVLSYYHISYHNTLLFIQDKFVFLLMLLWSYSGSVESIPAAH